MNWTQRSVSPTRATIIYAAEPVWGGAIGRLAGDRLPALAIVGAAVIVAGTLISEVKPRNSKAHQASAPHHVSDRVSVSSSSASTRTSLPTTIRRPVTPSDGH